MPDLQETVAMTVEQYYHTRVKTKEAQPRLPGDRRYRTLDEAARARSGIYALRNESEEKSNMILSSRWIPKICCSLAESSQIGTKNDVQNQKKYNKNQKHLVNQKKVEVDLIRAINAAKALLVNSP